MRPILLVCFFAGWLTGCVGYVHDSKVKELKPAETGLRDFAGTYSDKAAYFTPPNALGLQGNETLGGALRGLEFKSDVQIEITSADDIVVKATPDPFARQPLHYVKGRDFVFTNHCVVFRGERHIGGADSPGFGVFRTSMTWMLDDSGSLLIISGSSGAGFATIIPVVTSGSILSRFSRISHPKANH